MSNKLTFKEIYKNFKLVYPNLHKTVAHWRPYNYATIFVVFEDGRKATYNYDEGRLRFLKGE